MQQRKRRIDIKKIPVIIAAVVIGGSALAFAMVDETNSVHIDAESIEDSTLIVGSHLIYLESMTDQIYKTAMDSAEDSGQYNRYYKSELAGGTWYDVTEAGALADITEEGVVVQDKEIEALNMTHHTKSDGITYDLRTGKAVSIFDITDPYDLEGLDELEPIKLQYDTMVQTEDPSETMERDIRIIRDVYEKDRETDITREYDTYLESLQAYYEILVRDDAEAAMVDQVMKVMEKIDNARRAEVLRPLNDGQLEKMNRVVSREFVYIPGEVTGDVPVKDTSDSESDFDSEMEEEPEEEAGREELERFVLNTDLVTAIGEAMTNVQESYTEYSSNMLTEGTTVLSQVEYELCLELVGLAKANNYAGCDTVVQELIYLERVNDNVIREETAEREFIEAKLLGRAENTYKALLSAGENEAYRTLSSMASAATKANVLKRQKNDTEIARNELQFIMQAYIDRMPPETAMEYIAERIDNIGDLRSGIKTDAFQEYAQSSVDAHLEWLQQTMKSLQDDMGNRTMDSLMEQKDDLQTERMEALDHNQLGAAKKIEAQIEAIDKEIEDLETRLNQILNSENTSDSEKARAAAQLGEGSASAALQEMKNNALADMRDGNLDGIENIIDGIGALAATQPDGAMGALKDIYQELSKQELMNGGSSGAIQDLLRKVEDETAEQMQNFVEDLSGSDMGQLIEAFLNENGMGSSVFEEDVFDTSSGFGAGFGDGSDSGVDFGAGMGDGSGSSSGTGAGDTAGGTDTDAAAGNIGSILGGDALDDTMDRLSDGEMAIILSGLSMYAEETGSVSAKDVLLNYSRVSMGEGNAYLYDQLASDRSMTYVPTDRIAKITGYRYIFNDSQKAVTLQKGSQYYKFKAFSAVAEKGTTMEDMTKASGFQKVICIPADAAKSYFALHGEYLYGTNSGVLMTEDMQKLALAFFDYLLQAGGEF